MKYKKQITIAFISLFILGIISFGATSYISAARDPNLPDYSENDQDVQSHIQNLRISLLLSIVSQLQQLLQQLQQMILQQQIQPQPTTQPQPTIKPQPTIQPQPTINPEPFNDEPDISQESSPDFSQFIGVEFKESEMKDFITNNFAIPSIRSLYITITPDEEKIGFKEMVEGIKFNFFYTKSLPDNHDVIVFFVNSGPYTQSGIIEKTNNNNLKVVYFNKEFTIAGDFKVYGKILVNNKPLFIITEYTPRGGTCVYNPVFEAYLIENNNFKRILKFNKYTEFLEGVEEFSEVGFADLHGDGTTEIVFEGEQKFCKNKCNGCQDRVTGVKVARRVFEWNEDSQRFEEDYDFRLPTSSSVTEDADWRNYANINNWKTYTNTKHNYRLKVPQDFYNRAKPSGWVASSDDDDISFTKNNQWYIIIRHYQDWTLFSLPGETDVITPSVIDWLKKNSFIPEEYNLDRPNFEIGGIPAIRTVEEGIGISKHYRIVFIKDNKIFEVFVLADTDYDTENEISVEKVTEICNKILSSFEFI
ncbi:MAG TPA: hypothetical protein PLE40_00910 [Candidatus Pacearchaeota archaeon]|nr:hypothetical protein [Candidatus Pacearchaeota archaeon]